MSTKCQCVETGPWMPLEHMIYIHVGLVGCGMKCFWPPGFGSGGNLKAGCEIASGWLEAGSWLFMVFIGRVIKTKNHDHSINKVKNLDVIDD